MKKTVLFFIACLMVTVSAFAQNKKKGKGEAANKLKLETEYTTISGIKYTFKQFGKGTQASVGKGVSVQYILSLSDGKKVFSTRDNMMFPAKFNIGEGYATKGCEESITLMRPGDRAIFTVPPQFGFGDKDLKAIPKNSTLIFDIELIEITDRIARAEGLFTDTLVEDTSKHPVDTAAQVPVVKPYEKITLYVDSITNLISYIGVVEQEETGSDSLYIRAKRWAAKKFDGGKSIFDLDKKNVKLVLNCWMPAYAYNNKYTKRAIGKYEFKMMVWIKEGRYKYQITNFVHESVKSAEGVAARNYFEFYYTSPNNIKGNDLTLRYADKDIKKLVEDFRKHMKDPVVPDEEEW